MFVEQNPRQNFYSLRLQCSNFCNQRCDYCHVFNQQSLPLNQGLMNMAVARDAIDGFERLTAEAEKAHIKISLYGGEPLLNWRVLTEILSYGNHAFNGGRQVHWILNTNGTLLTSEIAEVLKRENVDVHLSIDGPGNYNNKYRKYKSGRPVLARVLDSIEILNRIGCNLQFDSCLTDANLYALKGLVDLAVRAGADRIYLAMTDTHKNVVAEKPEIALCAQKIIEVVDYGKHRGIDINGPWRRAISGAMEFPNLQNYVPYIIVDPGGNLYFSAYPDKPLGTVDRLDEIISLPKYRSAMADWKNEQITCQGCELVSTCKGYLKAMVMYHTGDSNGYERECRLALAISDTLTRMRPVFEPVTEDRKLCLSRQLMHQHSQMAPVVIHTMSGNAIQASAEILKFLNHFKEPNDAMSLREQYDSKDLRTAIGRLIDLGFLISDGFDEELDWLRKQPGPAEKREFNTEHCIMFYPDEAGPLARELSNILEALYFFLISQGLPSLKKAVLVCLCGSRKEFGQFWGAANLPDWPKAFVAKGRILVIDLQKLAKIDRSKEMFQRGMIHELVHIFINQISWKLPIWLEEGLCEYFSQPYSLNDFRRLAKEKKLYGIREIELAVEHSLLDLDRSPVFENICYWQSHSLVRYLVSLRGKDKLLQCVQETDLGQDFRTVFKNFYGYSLNDFEDEWLIHIASSSNIKDFSSVHRKLRSSKNLKYIENQNKVLIYNSFNGQSLISNVNIIELLDFFKTGKRLREVEAEYEIPNFENVISSLYHKRLLVFDHELEECSAYRKFDPVQVKTGALINKLRLNVSTRCNMACTYCYVDQDKSVNGRMSWETAKKTLKVFFELLQRHGHHHSIIRFFGGEPLLNWPLIKRAFKYVKTFKPEIKVNYVLNTNGTLVNDDIATTLASHHVSVNISIDGIGAVNDQYRRFKAGHGSFSTIDRNIDVFLANGCQVIVEATLCEHNIEHLNDLIDYVANKAVAFGRQIPLALQNLCMVSRPTRDRLAFERKVEKIANAIGYAQQKKLNIEQGMIYFPFQVVTGNRIPGVYCRGIGEEICIHPNGDIYPCGALKIRLGNIQKVEEVFQSYQYREIVNRVAGNIPACRGCEIEAFCAGGCAADAFEKQKDIFCSAGNCEIDRSIFKVLVKNYLLN